MGPYCIKDDYVHREGNATWDDGGRCFWTPERVRLSQVLQWYEYDWARSLIAKFAAREVLDIGCGPALKLNDLVAPAVERFVGIDQPSAIAYAQARFNRGEYRAVDLDRLEDCEHDPLLAQQYDFITCMA